MTAHQVTPEALVRSATRMTAVPFVPEVTLATAAEPYQLWWRTERDAPPFWAFPWAGGQGLARYVLDHPQAVRGRRVLDVASGSGLVAIAAARAGAAHVTATDIDENALAAIGLNAAANRAALTARILDLGDLGILSDASGQDRDGAVAGDGAGPEVVLAADVFYQRDLAAVALRFLQGAARQGATVLVADPGRAFVPAQALTKLARYEVPVFAVLEDTPVKMVTVYRLA